MRRNELGLTLIEAVLVIFIVVVILAVIGFIH